MRIMVRFMPFAFGRDCNHDNIWMRGMYVNQDLKSSKQGQFGSTNRRCAPDGAFFMFLHLSCDMDGVEAVE